ncbi:hypothetical protein [Pelagicoccus albus]|uniref:Uncharacterized protein n=1 Tax=Pelagicoccus albus TaxID=415222 RepID=A0A7X1EA99_9BACT|nr:hypothetical protein [Pelagicoccus albus]MBC2608166.1 hypothetical protein [Pelagicoccus albus]
MSSFKAITLIIVAALANPLCCCFGIDGLLAHIGDNAPKQEMHACCSMQNEAASEAEQSAGHDECPHQIDRLSKILETDFGSHLARPAFLPVFSIWADTLLVASPLVSDASYSRAPYSCPPLEANLSRQERCVYTL